MYKTQLQVSQAYEIQMKALVDFDLQSNAY